MVTSNNTSLYPNSSKWYGDNGDGTRGFFSERACVTQASALHSWVTHVTPSALHIMLLACRTKHGTRGFSSEKACVTQARTRLSGGLFLETALSDMWWFYPVTRIIGWSASHTMPEHTLASCRIGEFGRGPGKPLQMSSHATQTK